ncbi:hypothetical protein VPH35_066071 [Triticum aestivum]
MDGSPDSSRTKPRAFGLQDRDDIVLCPCSLPALLIGVGRGAPLEVQQRRRPAQEDSHGSTTATATAMDPLLPTTPSSSSSHRARRRPPTLPLLRTPCAAVPGFLSFSEWCTSGTGQGFPGRHGSSSSSKSSHLQPSVAFPRQAVVPFLA